MDLKNENNINPSQQTPIENKRRVVIASVDIENQVHDIAEERMLSSKAELKGFLGFLRKIWKHNLAHEYYRQKEMHKARREIQQSGDLYVGEQGDKLDHENAMSAIVKRFELEYESENLLRSGEEKKVLKKNNPADIEIKNQIGLLIKRFAGEGMTEDQFQIEKKKIIDTYSPKAKDTSVFVDNLLEIARQVKNNISHGQGLNALDMEFEVVIGKAKAGVETEAQYNAMEKIAEKMKKSVVGKFVKETTIASALIFAMTKIAKGSVNIAQQFAKLASPITAGLGFGIGGIISGMKENKRIKEERAQHAREMASGKTIEMGSKRREELEKFRYKTKDATELTDNLRKNLQRLTHNPNEHKLHEILESINEIGSRITFSEQEKVDLISFSDAKNIEQERTDMYIAVAEAKVFLKKNIQAPWATAYNTEQEFDEYMQNIKQEKIQKDFLQEKTLKDEAFNKMKKRKVAWSFSFLLNVRKPVEALVKKTLPEEKPTAQSIAEEKERAFDAEVKASLATAVFGKVEPVSVVEDKKEAVREKAKNEDLKAFLASLKNLNERRAEALMEKEKKHEAVRAASLHTIYKLKKYEEINAPTAEEADQKFLALTRELWDELTIHGKDEKGKVIKQADLDAYSCLELMELAGIKVEMDKVNFVKPGDSSESGIVMDTSKKHGVIAEDNGKRLIFDHHGIESDRTTCATSLVYETLIEMGLLKKEEYLDRYVEFVTKMDNFNFTQDEMKQIYQNYSKNLYGLAYKMKTKDVIELFRSGVNPMENLPDDYLINRTYFNKQKGLDEPLSVLSKFIQDQIKNGEKFLAGKECTKFVVDTGDDHFGKVLIDTKKTNAKGKSYNKVDGEGNSSQLAVFLKGYGAYVIWSPRENSFVVYTQKKMDSHMFSQGFNVRGHMWMRKRNDETEFTITLEEILSKLKGEPFKIGGDLKRKLSADNGAKETMNFIKENKLTEATLQETARKSNISLKELMLETMRQMKGMLQDFLKKVDKIKKPSNTDFIKNKDEYHQKINQIALGVLMGFQAKINGKNPASNP